mmetsp:Transcript_69784/g.110281  ORF Transcript_69784/g.110281 Transcript_69784/m.110281 type:complete len:347 (+) Transcript_69784:55-1095(+)
MPLPMTAAEVISRLQSSTKMQNKADFVKSALQQTGMALEFVNPKFQKDPQMAKLAVENNALALQFVSAQCKGLEQIALTAVKKNGLALQFVPPEICKEHILLAAVKQNGQALKYVHVESLNEDIVLAAVEKDAKTFELVPSRLRTQPVALAAVKQRPDLVEILPAGLGDDDEIGAAAVQAHARQSRAILGYADVRGFLKNVEVSEPGPGKFTILEEVASMDVFGESDGPRFMESVDNRGAVLEAVKENPDALDYASRRLKADRGIMLEAVKRDGWALKFAPEGASVRADKDVVLAAVGNDGSALQEASPELQQDRAVLLKAISQLKGRGEDKHVEHLKAKLATLQG